MFLRVESVVLGSGSLSDNVPTETRLLSIRLPPPLLPTPPVKSLLTGTLLFPHTLFDTSGSTRWVIKSMIHGVLLLRTKSMEFHIPRHSEFSHCLHLGPNPKVSWYDTVKIWIVSMLKWKWTPWYTNYRQRWSGQKKNSGNVRVTDFHGPTIFQELK